MEEAEEAAGMRFEPEDAEAAEITNVGFNAHSYDDEVNDNARLFDLIVIAD